MQLQHKSSTVNGIDIHYVTAGSGEPVLLWHGFCETWYCWRNVIPLLAEEYTVIAPDMRGFGDSSKPETGYDGINLAKDFRALMQSLGYSKIRMAAHDMGAPPALIYAGEYPDEVLALAYLEEPLLSKESMAQIHAFTPETTSKGKLWWWRFAFAPGMTERLILGREREFMTWFYQNNAFNHAAFDEETITEYLRTFAGEENINGAFGVYRAIFQTIDQTEKYLNPANKLKMPVLGLGGKSSKGDQVMEQLKSVAVNVSGGTVDNCGHFMPDEQPEELGRRLLKFFEAAASAQ